MTKKKECIACLNMERGVKTRKAVPHTCSEDSRKDRLESLLKTKSIIESGYAGILSNGNIVDRREHPDAMPIQENPLFNTPKPKKI